MSLRKVEIAGQSENSSNAEIHLEIKRKNVILGKGSRQTTTTILLPVSGQNGTSMKLLEDS